MVRGGCVGDCVHLGEDGFGGDGVLALASTVLGKAGDGVIGLWLGTVLVWTSVGMARASLMISDASSDSTVYRFPA